MARSFELPDLGEGVHEGEVLAVHVIPGQQIQEGDIILEVETDKAAVEIPSPYTGKVTEVRVNPGDLVNVGQVMIVFDDGEAATVPDKPAVAVSQPERKSKKLPVAASPATRRLARELGVSLKEVTPSGRGGVVTAEDVRAYADQQKEATPQPEKTKAPTKPPPTPSAQKIPSPQLPDFSQWGPVERVPFRSIRRATARQMATSWSQIPHVNSQDTLDITRLEAFRQKHKNDIKALGGRLTLTVFALKAAATALKHFPNFNAALDLDAQEIILKKYYHIGVAVNSDHGLMVPVIRDVDRKSIKELSVELHELVQRTRDRNISREELQGGTFTITNAGAMGGGFFTPIINHPQVAIMGMGQARMQPVVITEDNGEHQIVPRLIAPLVLCIDHRVLDGGDSIGFLNAVVEALEDPDELLMSMT